MNANIEKMEDSKVKIDVTVEAEKFDKALDDVFRKNAKYFMVPGFRKGKAPRKIVENYYGKGVLYEDAFNMIVPDMFEKIIEENKLEVVSTPEIDITQMEAGKELKFVAVVTVKPEFKLGKYKGIKLEKKDYTVTDEDIENELKEMAEKNSRIVAADKRRKLKDGDTAVIDFEGFVDGVAFEGGKAEGYSLEIGSGSFIPGFEEQLVGMKYDEEKEIKVTFPEDYMSEDLAGKEATFKIKLHEIKVKEVPEIDDEFAKDVSEFDSLEELKEDIKSKMEDENASKAKFEEEENAINQVLEATELKIPKAMIESEIDMYIQNMTHEELMISTNIAKALGFTAQDSYDEVSVYTRGYRVLNKIPRMPSNIVDNLVKSFKSFQHILAADLEQLDAVDGIGEVRARTIKQSLKRMQEQFVFDNLML